jgi:hypothetical protein
MNVAKALLSSLANAEGLQGLADVGHRLLGNPLIIADHSCTALAMTDDVDIAGDVGWDEFSGQGTLSSRTASRSLLNSLAERIEQNALPFFWEDSGMKYRRLIGRVSIRNRTVGTVSAIEYERAFTDDDISVMALFCDAVSAEMQKDGERMYARSLLYEHFAIYRIADVCMSAPYTDLRSLSHTGLFTLIEYDSRHGTTFSQSLRTYLAYNRNITDAAKALHLHRNTMLYHMKRAEEIMDANLSDADTLLHIEMSYRFIDYENGIPE